MRRIRRGQLLFIIISIIVVGGLFIIYQNTSLTIEKFPILAFFISVIASILASLIYSILNDSFFSTQQEELVEKLSLSTNVLEDKCTKGIIGLQFRDEIKEDYWRSFIINANDTLILSGKTLHRWIFTDERKQMFSTYIIKKINNGCKVTFVMYKEGSLSNQDKEEREKFKTFLFENVFNEIYKKNITVQGSLTIKETDRLPYFYITNGVESVAMPYFANASNDGNLTYIMKHNSKLNLHYLEDYEKIISNSGTNNWINEYKKSVS